ncbi:MAG: 30S ribosomal protein S3 [bacterium]|nr:30S ribosomal protein S3 [bacterium]
MGQKIHPIGFRLGISQDWQSRWYASKKDYSKNLLEDYMIRRFLNERLKLAGLVGVEIERLIHKMKIIIHVTRPGVVIGRGGSGLEDLKKNLLSRMSLSKSEKNIQIEVAEVKAPDLSAVLTAGRIAGELERRLPHRRVVARATERTMSAGAKGIRVVLSGRIAGAEIARRETYNQGKLPLGRLRANIDFAKIPALTRSGYVGVKVWIYTE